MISKEYDPVAELCTLRDWIRYGTSCFRSAGLVFGHGTQNATDEAAFLLLSSLDLPIDQLDPWLDCKLTHEERKKIASLFEKRISTRKPASYLINKAYIGDKKFFVDERVIVPRSYIGELLRDGLQTIISNPDAISSVLDLCTGSGCLAILAALNFTNSHVAAVDISPEALQVADINISEYGLKDRIMLLQSDLFSGLKQDRFDLILSNPPYVMQKAIEAFPPEYQAEPRIAHFGGKDGLDIVRRILREAPRYLSSDGILVVEVGTGRDLLENEYPNYPFFWLDTEISSGEVFVLRAEEISEKE
ncbi:MAG: 50S ribosomal protein L3 N(5)-glutamine methyltransferase [Hyphomicrobium sp.]